MAHVSSSLAIIEDFYGEALSPGMLRKISDTPLDQLLELADRLGVHGARVSELLETRIWHADQRRSVARSNGIPETYDHFLGEDVYTHDRLILDGGIARPVADVDELKHLLLYCDKILVPDLTLPWAHGINLESANNYPLDEKHEGMTLARFLQPLIGLAPLIHSGELILVPPAHDLSVGEEPFTVASDLFYQAVYCSDPFLAWAVVNKLELAEPWELSIRSLSDVREAAEYCISKLRADGEPTSEELASFGELVREKLWPGLSARDVTNILGFSFITRESATIPVSSDAATFHHLKRCGDLLLDSAALRGEKEREDHFVPAVNYRIPSLANVTLDDIIKLRDNEELFNDLRECLTRLTSQAASVSYDGGPQHYSQTIGELAEDLVRPTWARIDQMRKKASRRNFIWGTASAGAVSLGVNALGTLVGIPPHIGSAVSNSSANVVRSKVLKSRRKTLRDLEVAGSVLYSLVETPS